MNVRSRLARPVIWALVVWMLCIPASGIAAISVVDATGQTVVLDRTPQRIVVVGTAYFVPLHMLYLFPEAGHLLVGYEKRSKGEEQFLPLLDPNYRDKITLGTNPGPEQIAALKPDLVLIKGSVAGHLARSLAILKIPVLHVGVENPQRFLKDIEALGKVLNNERRSAEIIEFYHQRLSRISQGLAQPSGSQKPDVLMLEYSKRGGTAAVRVPARPWIQTIQIETAGGNPVWLDQYSAPNGWQVVGFEQIAHWNPDKIFMVVWHTCDAQKVLRDLKADPKWRLLKAVSTDELYLFPQDIYGWDSPDPRWILGMLWSAKQIHPSLFGDINIQDEVYLFFTHMYGLNRSVVDREIMPRISANAAK